MQSPPTCSECRFRAFALKRCGDLEKVLQRDHRGLDGQSRGSPKWADFENQRLDSGSGGVYPHRRFPKLGQAPNQRLRSVRTGSSSSAKRWVWPWWCLSKTVSKIYLPRNTMRSYPYLCAQERDGWDERFE